ncbi:MAG TPA: M3 family metallopeptidase [Vicinamibacterales bacterium]|jgi:peptidyl-dipeptidase Dcp
MFKPILSSCVVLTLVMTVAGCAQKPEAPVSQVNPLLTEWTTPFGAPPFNEIKPEHFLPAFKVAIDEQRKEVERIAANAEPPTFANTLEALENSGVLLGKVRAVFQNLSSSETSEALQAVNREVAPMLSATADDIRMNPRLFARVKAVWEQRERLGLSGPQRKLLDDTYKEFVRNGANLDAAGQARLRAINTELSSLGVAFDEHHLYDTNAYQLVIERREDLAGLTPDIIAAAAEAAKAAKLPGKWVFGLQSPSIWPFLSYADNRELRRQILAAYTSRCDHGDQWDNKKNAARQAALRLERSKLLGYKTFADFVLEEEMAKTPAAVYDLLNRVWVPAREMAIREAAALREIGAKAHPGFTLEASDWRYYTEKIRKSRFDLDEESLRPYFSLDRVRDGAFAVATKLYGITFTRRTDLPIYHPDVATFEVKDRDGSHLGVLYTDFHPRPGKNSGAWSDRFRPQWVMGGRDIRPIATMVCNFPRPVGAAPSQIGLEDVRTLFHEFGHALHTLLSRVRYRSLNGVPTDFVELPSQIMENWALEPDVLKLYATHFKTGQPIPADLVAKIKKSATFNQGFTTVEYLAACLLDMDWHTLTMAGEQDTAAFDKASMEKIRLLPEIVVRYRSPYFSHVFGEGGGYAAGYYSYIWSEVLDKDAFEAFKEKGLFDEATARAFRVLLEKGGSEEAMVLYKAFRGKEPSVEPLLKARGLK